MAWKKTVEIVGSDGHRQTFKGGLLDKDIKVEHSHTGICVTQEDRFGYEKKTTCIHQPSVEIGKKHNR